MYPRQTGSLVEDSVVVGQHQAPLKTQEIIPLKEYCRSQDNLRKIQAQSSAETSGLGDSLQRIHTLSSTETSGYGDAGLQSPGTGASPSPESGRGRTHGSLGRVTGTSAWSPASRRSPHPTSIHYRQSSPERGRTSGGRDDDKLTSSLQRTPSFEQAMLTTDVDKGYVGGSDSRRHSPTKRSVVAFPGPFSMRPDEDETDAFYIPQRRSTSRRSGHYIAAEQGPSSVVSPHFQRGYADNHRASLPQLSATDAEVLSYTSRDPYDGRTRGGSIPQTSSHSNNRQMHRSPSDVSMHSGLFLGAATKSQWLEWSHERRASFKKRLDSIEQRQKELERTRVSTPVRKARKESIMFVSPELEDSHLQDDGSIDLDHVYLGANIHQGSKARRREEELRAAMDGKLTVTQWNLLLAFWEHDLFVSVRYLGMLLSVVAFILGVVAATSNNWLSFQDGAVTCGLWSSSTEESDLIDCQAVKRSDWQNAVIGLLLFSVAFGFLASVLSICGVCTGALPKKIYYYHSAGEIFLICALSCTAALVVYPVAIEVGPKLGPHSLGFGYGLGWGASVFYFAASLCMCLDDIVRTCTQGCCLCCRKDRNNSPL